MKRQGTGYRKYVERVNHSGFHAFSGRDYRRHANRRMKKLGINRIPLGFNTVNFI